MKRPLRILILGSCVTRDALEYQEEPHQIELAGYFARSPLGSAMHPVVFDGVDVDVIPSKFQARMVRQDLTGTLPKALCADNWDLVVLDLIDDRFTILENEEGARATYSPEFRASNYDDSHDRRIDWPSQENLDWWLWGWAELSRVLKNLGRFDNLRLNRVWWSADPIDPQAPAVVPPLNPAPVEAANARLAERYSYIEKELPPEHIYHFQPDQLRIDPNHKWGQGYFHYARTYYDALLRQLLDDRARYKSRWSLTRPPWARKR